MELKEVLNLKRDEMVTPVRINKKYGLTETILPDNLVKKQNYDKHFMQDIIGLMKHYKPASEVSTYLLKIIKNNPEFLNIIDKHIRCYTFDGTCYIYYPNNISKATMLLFLHKWKECDIEFIDNPIFATKFNIFEDLYDEFDDLLSDAYWYIVGKCLGYFDNEIEAFYLARTLASIFQVTHFNFKLNKRDIKLAKNVAKRYHETYKMKCNIFQKVFDLIESDFIFKRFSNDVLDQSKSLYETILQNHDSDFNNTDSSDADSSSEFELFKQFESLKQQFESLNEQIEVFKESK